jgi:F0F1-type ATP synthase membrane subunit b/b'
MKLLLLIFPSMAIAGSGAGLSSLIAPAVNLSLLIIFLVWKTKKPLKDYFENKALDISQTLDRANLKAKEAKVLLENQERKLASLQNEIKEIKNRYEQDLKQFENEYQAEINQKIAKLRSDSVGKIESNRKNMFKMLNEKILNDVISKTKKNVAQSSEIQKKASGHMLEGLK